MNTWFGFVAPAGTPREIVMRLNSEINRIVGSNDAREKLGPQGFDLTPGATPETFAKTIADDLASWVPLVKAAGARAD